jgi:hypothetical protein
LADQNPWADPNFPGFIPLDTGLRRKIRAGPAPAAAVGIAAYRPCIRRYTQQK